MIHHRRVFMTADTVGGVLTYSLELARGLGELGCAVCLATLGGRMSDTQRKVAESIPLLILYESDYPLEWMHPDEEEFRQAGRWLLDLAMQFAPDIVHLNHYGHGHLPWPAPTLMVAHSCVYAWHLHTLNQQPGPEWEPYRRRVTNSLLAVNAVVVPTRAALHDIGAFYPLPRRLWIIYNGRRPEEFPGLRKLPYILGAGRLWDEAKNFAVLDAAAQGLDWPLKLAGEARHPQGHSAHFEQAQLLGLQSPQQMAELYGRAAIYALPARYEPFGLSALEAAFAGCALVLGDTPSLREIWQGAAEFVPPDDPQALRSVLKALIGNQRYRQRLGRAAYQRAQCFKACTMAEQYLRCYRILMGYGRRPPETSPVLNL